MKHQTCLFCQNATVATQDTDSVVGMVPMPAWQGRDILPNETIVSWRISSQVFVMESLSSWAIWEGTWRYWKLVISQAFRSPSCSLLFDWSVSNFHTGGLLEALCRPVLMAIMFLLHNWVDADPAQIWGTIYNPVLLSWNNCLPFGVPSMVLTDRREMNWLNKVSATSGTDAPWAAH